MSENTLTRSALYDLVWAESITSIAKRFAVRSAEVVKACETANVPRPPNGYWMKLSYGKAPERPLLPPLEVGQFDTVTIESKPPRVKAVAPKADVATAGNAVEEASTEVPKPPPVHRFVRQTEKALRGSRPSTVDGLISPDHRTGPLFSVEVAKSSVARALELLTQIVCVALDDGVELVELKGQYNSTVAFQASGEEVALSIKEKVAREEIKPEAGGSRHWKDYKYTPTGLLKVELDAPYGCGLRSTWGDGKIQRLESCVTDIGTAIKGICAAKMKNRLEQEERERKWAEEAKLRRERDRQEALEKTRRECLSQHMEAWQTSKGLTAFADAVAAITPVEDEAQEWRDWISWIRDQASALDPLTQKKRPWHEWAAHLRLSSDTAAASSLWPGHHVWKSLNV